MKDIIIKNNATFHKYWNKTKYFLENTFEGFKNIQNWTCKPKGGTVNLSYYSCLMMGCERQSEN